MRFASTGPTPGSDSICAALARSMSSSARTCALDDARDVSRVTRCGARDVRWAPLRDFFARLASRAESAAMRWRARAALSVLDGTPRAARTTRTDAPSTRTPAMKMRARCSFFVGMSDGARTERDVRHQISANEIKALRFASRQIVPADSQETLDTDQHGWSGSNRVAIRQCLGYE